MSGCLADEPSCGHRPVHLARIKTPVFANPAAGTAEQKIADLKAQVETHLELRSVRSSVRKHRSGSVGGALDGIRFLIR